jgi:TusA-related sulfurtransferase
MMPGDHLRVICTDPAAAVDFPAFCQAAGHSLVETTCMDETAAADKELVFLICRGG